MIIDDFDHISEQIRQIARIPNLIVACDYDGTLAPNGENPGEAKPNRDAVAAMRSLANQANTHVAVISGRSLRDLAAMSRLPEEIRLIGSHGGEVDLGFVKELPADLRSTKDTIISSFDKVSQETGAVLERKPTGAVLHFISVEDAVRQAAENKLLEEFKSLDDIHVRRGKRIFEVSVVDTNKGVALEDLRKQLAASAVLFIGDDLTDEDAFATLIGPDLGIKVGDGETKAQCRVSDTTEVAKVLALLSEARAEWLKGASLVPIEDHSMLSDLRTAAIVSPAARITWFCAPRADSASIFSELLGGPSAGHFAIEDADGNGPTSQRYLENTMILRSDFSTFNVIDYLDSSSGRTRRLAGRSDLIRVIEGTGKAQISFAPRLDFGRVPTYFEIKEHGLVVKGTSELIVMRSGSVQWEIIKDGMHESAIATVDLSEGPVTLEMRIGTGTTRPSSKLETERREGTDHYWSNWAAKLELPQLRSDLVNRSALVLKGLCHGPTGAILAAATTSLPETIGGIRNWDYRYCWLRDAALTATSLTNLGSHAEAMAYLDWVLRILEDKDDPERLSPLYNVNGRHLPPEAEITQLPGYGSSRPVRVGNAADGQVQLDVFGPIVDLIYVLAERGEALSSGHWKLVEAMVLAVSRRWHEPDHGIWEIRKPPRHHVYSKVMCWVTVDRAISIAENFTDDQPQEWVELRDQIAEDILTNGWNDNVQSFTAAYDGEDLDSSVLAVGLWGLIEPKDPRFVATVEAVEKKLRVDSTVYRYFEDDGLPGKEGGFNLMTSWLIDSLAMIGRIEDAKSLFEDYCSLVGATGIMAEEYDPDEDRALGNMPQAYSHLGLINNALRLDNV